MLLVYAVNTEMSYMDISDATYYHITGNQTSDHTPKWQTRSEYSVGVDLIKKPEIIWKRVSVTFLYRLIL